MDKKEFVLKAVADKRALIVDVSDKIFGYAEVGFHEFRTAKLYEEVLKKEGFQVAMAVAEALDVIGFHEIVGCVAGDNTIMCAVRTVDDTIILMDKLKKIIEGK